jgi:hypothetical protein
VNVEDNAQCVPAMNAIRTVAADIKTIQISCSDDSVLGEAGTLADGELFYGGLDSIAGADSPDTRIFNHIVEAYGQPAVDGFNGAAGVSPTVTLARVLEKQGGKQVTRESVLKAFADSKGVTRFMGPPLECGEFKYPRMCTASLRIFTIEGGKKKVLTDWISYPDYVR